MYKKALASAALAVCSLAAVAADSGKALKAGSEYLITTNYPNNLRVVDIQSDTLYKSCQLPGDLGPGAIQMSPDRRIAYVLNNHYADVYGIEVDTCKPVFHASLAQKFAENARAMMSVTVSHDGKEIYAIVNPTMVFTDHYEVQPPRLDVYPTDGGLNVKPVRSFPAPRQITIMQTGDDGSLYAAGPDIYKVDTKTGRFDVFIPGRSWSRPDYSPPDMLYMWSQQTWSRDFLVLYTAAKFKDDKKDLATADYMYGFFNVNLATGKPEAVDFAPFTEVYFTGMRSPKDPNLIFTVLSSLGKFDIREQKLIKSAGLDHSYYCITLNKAGDKIYLTGTLNDIAIFNADTMERIGSLKLPGGDMAATTSQAFIR